MTRSQQPDSLHEGLVDVALIDGRSCAAAAGISQSQWFALVARGDAPQPAFRGNRCTRWKLAEVRAWLAGLANTGLPKRAPAKSGTRQSAAKPTVGWHANR